MERLLGRLAEVGTIDRCQDIRVSVDELHEFLQTPEAAFTQAHDHLHWPLVCTLLLDLILNILDSCSDGFDYCYDQRAKCEGSRVIPGS